MTKKNFGQGFGLVGDGELVVFALGNGAAGTAVEWVVPSNVCFELLTASFGLSTDANVATRAASILVLLQGQIYWPAVTSVTQAASLTNVHSFGQGLGAVVIASGFPAVVLPRIIAAPGTIFRFTATNMQVGDVINAPSITGLYRAL